MTQKHLLSDEWYQSLAEMIALIGNNDFSQYFAQLCQSLTGYDSTVLIAFLKYQKPSLIFSNLSSKDETPTLGPYFDGAFLLDPFYDLYRNKAADGIYRLSDVAPEVFSETEYYRSYFKNTRIIDESAMMVKITEEICLSASFGLRDGSKPRELQLRELRKVFPILASTFRQHWSRENQLAPLLDKGTTNGQFGTTLEAAFSNFGSLYLTKRECEIVKLILKGYSSKSIASLLEISVDTVKVHRKRFHNKLDISSQAELFSLFLEAISMVPLGAELDPLHYYYSSQEIVDKNLTRP
ncbi:MAG: helix-turn-helix transcriptional regulator [Gammaproteobacteria bacterium]|nr:helix-turn-helix transcriptional regulator [Gammaproteobacteria bacterium]MBT6246032.1 helix-turn-helix transcriptional regulator [Gammaproteobacteria bacterium]